MHARRTPPGPAPSVPIWRALASYSGGRLSEEPAPWQGYEPAVRACQSWGRCHLGRPVARDSTMPPMTGPGHYHRAEQLPAEASELIRVRQQPGQCGPADLPVRPQDAEERRRLSSDPGLPDRSIAEAGASPKPRSMPPSPWPPPPRSPAWARTAGRRPILPEPSSAADNSRRRDRHPPAGLPPNGPRSQTQPPQMLQHAAGGMLGRLSLPLRIGRAYIAP